MGYVRWLQTNSNPVFKNHAPQPMSKAMAGGADYHVTKRESVEMAVMVKPPSPVAQSSEVGWRPWHAYPNHCWAQVKQNKLDVTAAMTTDLCTGQALGGTFGDFGTAQQQMSRSVGSLSA